MVEMVDCNWCDGNASACSVERKLTGFLTEKIKAWIRRCQAEVEDDLYAEVLCQKSNWFQNVTAIGIRRLLCSAGSVPPGVARCYSFVTK